MVTINNNFFIINKVIKRPTIHTRQFKNKKVQDIEIEVEQLSIPFINNTIIMMERPVSVKGVIVPTLTKGRKSPPNPVSFDALTKYIRSTIPRKKFNVLSPNSDRGHVFALELGGVDNKYNIIPQWGGFQRYGDWRKLEKSFKNRASHLNENNNTLFLEINLDYLNLEMHDIKEKIFNIFSFNNPSNISEEKIIKCLQIFGTPVGYIFDTYPCNMYITKPRGHSLSISYIKYLYEIAYKVYHDERDITVESKILNAQRILKLGWGLRKLKLTDLVNINCDLINNISNYCISGKFELSMMTTADI